MHLKQNKYLLPVAAHNAL